MSTAPRWTSDKEERSTVVSPLASEARRLGRAFVVSCERTVYGIAERLSKADRWEDDLPDPLMSLTPTRWPPAIPQLSDRTSVAS